MVYASIIILASVKTQQTLIKMRPWRNWQTRTFEGRVGDRMGSSPIGRTIFKKVINMKILVTFFMLFCWGLEPWSTSHRSHQQETPSRN